MVLDPSQDKLVSPKNTLLLAFDGDFAVGFLEVVDCVKAPVFDPVLDFVATFALLVLLKSFKKLSLIILLII